MTEKTVKVLGVDFSGAGKDTDKGKTWLAEGDFNANSLTLTLKEPRQISRKELASLLIKADRDAIAALDFPFSVPESFVKYWGKCDKQIGSPKRMPDLWKAAARLDMSNDNLRKWCEKFVEGRKGKINPPELPEPKRRGDYYHPESFSPLHRVRPNMVPMTFHGMKMLHKVWSKSQCKVHPLDCPNRTGPTLLEVMPGSVLVAMGLPYQRYKGKEERDSKLREYIWGNLRRKSGIKIDSADVEKLKKIACENDDCLDAVIAAIAAALWHHSKENFHCPPTRGSANYDEVILKEGWLYKPCPSKLPVGDNR